MDKVKVLDKNLANMISAGEVVERPASVVKELVENSIDSYPTSIVIEIKNGGKTYIRVTDDGCGMSRVDARTAFLRHATSKISSPDDLYNIKTMGFRGEALAAISAVSKVEMLTARSEDGYGIRIVFEGGEQLSLEDVGVPTGTTVIVRDLFYNTPARMNFMKKDSTESAAIVSLVNKLAFSNNLIAIKLIVDGKTVLSTHANREMPDTIYSVFGREIAENMVSVSDKKNNYSINGYVSLPKCNRANRNYQYLYINNRVVKSKTVTAAIDRAYKNLLMNGKYAVTVLKINVPTDSVDVNVHPTKMEVKFKDEQIIFELVYYAIKNALDQERQLENFMNNSAETQPPVKIKGEYFKVDFVERPESEYIANVDIEEEPSAQSEKKEFDAKEFDKIFAGYQGNNSFINFFDEKKNNTSDSYDCLKDSVNVREVHIGADEYSEKFKQAEDDPITLLNSELPVIYIGEIFKTYIVIEYGTSFYLIDKHAAHERILFNKIYNEYINAERYTQDFLCAIPLTLSPEEADFVRVNKEKFNKLGFAFDEFGEYDILIRSVPYVLSPGDTVPAFLELVNILSENINETMTEIENKNIRMLACKAAIKAGYDSSETELKQFIKQVLSEPNTNYCPHGRPIFCEYTRDSIEKAFKRIV